MIEWRAADWSELNEALFADTWNSTIRRFRSTFAYRGVSAADHTLTNGLTRLGKPYPMMEQNLLKQFKKYAHRHVVERDKINYSQVHELLQQQDTRSLDKLGARIFSVDALAETIPNLPALDQRSAANFEIAVFFEPPAIDDRIVNQFAYFSVLSNPYLVYGRLAEYASRCRKS
jgi:hypothetical protein